MLLPRTHAHNCSQFKVLQKAKNYIQLHGCTKWQKLRNYEQRIASIHIPNAWASNPFIVSLAGEIEACGGFCTSLLLMSVTGGSLSFFEQQQIRAKKLGSAMTPDSRTIRESTGRRGQKRKRVEWLVIPNRKKFRDQRFDILCAN